MKKLLALASVCMFITTAATAAEPSQADQKWLQVVEKKITSGETQVSTPAKERAELLREWASSNGYSAQVTQSGQSYRIDLAKTKEVAQK